MLGFAGKEFTVTVITSRAHSSASYTVITPRQISNVLPTVTLLHAMVRLSCQLTQPLRYGMPPHLVSNAKIAIILYPQSFSYDRCAEDVNFTNSFIMLLLPSDLYQSYIFSMLITAICLF